MRWPPPPDWPHANQSRQVPCKPHRWHVQETGQGETVLLLHGAGGSTHSYRDVIPILARSHHVIALDLPGQGFTQLGARHRCGLDAMTEDIAALCLAQNWQPAAIVGHSAGGAIALRLSQHLGDVRLVGLNPALGHFRGIAGVLFPAMAKLLAMTPFTASVFSRTSATPNRIAALIKGTGSEIGPEGLELYRRLVADRDHVDASLRMMAQWSLDELLADLPKITSPTLFLVGQNDRAVTPASSQDAAMRMPDATVTQLPDLGHLAHEESPEAVSGLILDFLA